VESQARKGRGDLMGRTRCYRKVIFPAVRDLIGQMVPVQINEASSTILKGSLV
jgi:tRNA A37 methylthiotransferase MiaB